MDTPNKAKCKACIEQNRLLKCFEKLQKTLTTWQKSTKEFKEVTKYRKRPASEAIDKCIKVINSCVTLRQLETANCMWNMIDESYDLDSTTWDILAEVFNKRLKEIKGECSF